MVLFTQCALFLFVTMLFLVYIGHVVAMPAFADQKDLSADMVYENKGK